MSTDLYDVRVDAVGPASDHLEALPWLTRGVRRLGLPAKVPNHRQLPVDALLAAVSALIAAAPAASASRVIPADDAVLDKVYSEAVKKALLHRHHPDQHPPQQLLGVFTVRVLEEGFSIPTQPADRDWFARFLWSQSSDHPLRAEYSDERILSPAFHLPNKHRVLVAFTSRAKSGAPLYALAPPDWFAGVRVGERYPTTAF